jgi:hypothetical protein
MPVTVTGPYLDGSQHLLIQFLLLCTRYLTMRAHSNSKTSPSLPKRKQPFTFVRSKLETKMRDFQRRVYLNGDIYHANVAAATLQNALVGNIPVSHSGRTLAEILNLSHPNNLSQYTVDSVVRELGWAGVVVRYSRPERESEIEVSFSSFLAFLVTDAYPGAPENNRRNAGKGRHTAIGGQ